MDIDSIKKEVKEIVKNGTIDDAIWEMFQLDKVKFGGVQNTGEYSIIGSLQDKLIKKIPLERLLEIFKDMQKQKDLKPEFYSIMLDLQARIAERIGILMGKKFEF